MRHYEVMMHYVTTFYKFMPLPKEKLAEIKRDLEEQAKRPGSRILSPKGSNSGMTDVKDSGMTENIMGLILVAEEGVNATISGSEESLKEYKKFLDEYFDGMTFKDSKSAKAPFRRFKVKIKPEIVGLKRLDVQPRDEDVHLSPEEWDKMMEDEDVAVIDVRNWYETKLGSFKNAIDPKTFKFSQFPKWVKKSGIDKNKKIAMFCTGGIRCEKAAVAMKEQGYDEVYQLDGGILNYIEKRPNKNFEGECFVFDHRVSVRQDLRESDKYAVCWMCGNGGNIEAKCTECGKDYKYCDDCQDKVTHNLCSKACCGKIEA